MKMPTVNAAQIMENAISDSMSLVVAPAPPFAEQAVAKGTWLTFPNTKAAMRSSRFDIFLPNYYAVRQGIAPKDFGLPVRILACFGNQIQIS